MALFRMAENAISLDKDRAWEFTKIGLLHLGF